MKTENYKQNCKKSRCLGKTMEKQSKHDIFCVLSVNFLIKLRKQLQEVKPTCAHGSAFRLLQLPSIDLSEKF